MSEETEKSEQPEPGPGVIDWLKDIVGAPRSSLASARPELPSGLFVDSAAHVSSRPQAEAPQFPGEEESGNTAAVEEDIRCFVIKLLPPVGAEESRVNVFVDGSIAADSVIVWGDDPDTIHDLEVPCTFDGIPYEILIRLRANDDGDTARPGFLGLQFEGNFISGNMPTVSGQGEWDGESRRWSGDILIDLPGALAEDMAASPEPLSITSAEQISDKPLLSEQERAVDAFDAAAEEPVSDEDDENTLVVRVTYEDVSRPEFIAELRQLRDFIHARTGDHESGHYDRLELDVRKWHKMRVAGPTGADVDLDPELPDLAPTGGLDNTRALKSLRLPNGGDKYMGEVRVTEVPPGALLTHGKNLGDGVWQLSTEEARLAAVLPAIADTTTSVIRVSTSDQDNGGELLRKSLLLGPGTLFDHAPSERPIMRLKLDASIFDPDGHKALSLTIGDLPPGCILDCGKNHGDGVWTVESESDSIIGVSALNSTPTFSMNMTCVALNSETGESTVVSRRIGVNPKRATIDIKPDVTG